MHNSCWRFCQWVWLFVGTNNHFYKPLKSITGVLCCAALWRAVQRSAARCAVGLGPAKIMQALREQTLWIIQHLVPGPHCYPARSGSTPRPLLTRPSSCNTFLCPYFFSAGRKVTAKTTAFHIQVSSDCSFLFGGDFFCYWRGGVGGFDDLSRGGGGGKRGLFLDELRPFCQQQTHFSYLVQYELFARRTTQTTPSKVATRLWTIICDTCRVRG